MLSDPEHKRKFATGGRTKVSVHVTGVVKVDDAKAAVLEGDVVESEKKYASSLELNKIKKIISLIVTCNACLLIIIAYGI